MPNSIWDTRFTPPKVALDADVEAAFLALDEWITIKGTHVELGENGEILHGMGGKFKNVHDVPRNTVKQREGESIEQTHERAGKIFGEQDFKESLRNIDRMDKKWAHEEISKMTKDEHDDAMQRRENRILSEWKADPPAYVENDFVDNELRAGNISKDVAQTMKESTGTRIERENEKGDKLLLSFKDSKGNYSKEPQWVPKKYLVSVDEHQSLLPIPF